MHWQRIPKSRKGFSEIDFLSSRSIGYLCWSPFNAARLIEFRLSNQTFKFETALFLPPLSLFFTASLSLLVEAPAGALRSVTLSIPRDGLILIECRQSHKISLDGTTTPRRLSIFPRLIPKSGTCLRVWQRRPRRRWRLSLSSRWGENSLRPLLLIHFQIKGTKLNENRMCSPGKFQTS